MRRLKAAGAREPAPAHRAEFPERISALAKSITTVQPMMRVANVRETVEWYRAIGFELEGVHEIDTDAAWAGVSFGGAYSRSSTSTGTS